MSLIYHSPRSILAMGSRKRGMDRNHKYWFSVDRIRNRNMTENGFASPAKLKDALTEQMYIANDEIATVTFLSQQLGKPVLLEGPAGVGKTELAKAVACAAGRDLIRLQCYEGLDETKALYEWEYAKQLLS